VASHRGPPFCASAGPSRANAAHIGASSARVASRCLRPPHHYDTELGPALLAEIAKDTGLTPDDL
jgi:hypothetical protein